MLANGYSGNWLADALRMLRKANWWKGKLLSDMAVLSLRFGQ